MNKTGAHIIREALEKEKIRFVFGIPGTHNIELYDELMDSASLCPILVTDEQSAGFMADGVARSVGGLAALNLVPGAGLTHALSGIAEAWLDQVPMLVLMCGVRKDVPYAYQLHDIDQVSIVKPVTKAVFQHQTHQELATQLQEACRITREAPQGPVAIEIPANLYMTKGTVNAVSTPQPTPPSHRFDSKTVQHAAALLAGAKRIGIYAGMGAVDAQ